MRKIKPDVVHSHNLHPHLFQLAKWEVKIRLQVNSRASLSCS